MTAFMVENKWVSIYLPMKIGLWSFIYSDIDGRQLEQLFGSRAFSTFYKKWFDYFIWFGITKSKSYFEGFLTLKIKMCRTLLIMSFSLMTTVAYILLMTTAWFAII